MNNFRPLLPASHQKPCSTNSVARKVKLVRKRRQAVSVACDSCRVRKTACDGTRPVCSRCVDHDRACHYEIKAVKQTSNVVLERRLRDAEQDRNDYADIIERLRSAPDAEAIAVLQSLRSSRTSDLPSILSSVQNGLCQETPSCDISTYGIPSPQSDIDPELGVFDDLVCPALNSLDIAFVDANGFFVSDWNSWPIIPLTGSTSEDLRTMRSIPHSASP